MLKFLKLNKILKKCSTLLISVSNDLQKAHQLFYYVLNWMLFKYHCKASNSRDKQLYSMHRMHLYIFTTTTVKKSAYCKSLQV